MQMQDGYLICLDDGILDPVKHLGEVSIAQGGRVEGQAQRQQRVVLLYSLGQGRQDGRGGELAAHLE